MTTRSLHKPLKPMTPELSRQLWKLIRSGWVPRTILVELAESDTSFISDKDLIAIIEMMEEQISSRQDLTDLLIHIYEEREEAR